MDEVARLLTWLALVGAAFAVLGAVLAWFLDERRRLTRTLTQALGAPPSPLLIARGRGAAIGFDLASGQVATAWDRGGWRLTFRLDELIGAELIVDRRVAGRAFRGEPRRALDELAAPEDLVRLRFVFDDPHHPDFELDLWRPEDEGRRGRFEPDEALHEANRWLARLEALLRRSGGARPPAASVAPPARTAPAPAAAPWTGDDDDDLVDDAEDVIT
jgi:hypothetical protein